MKFRRPRRVYGASPPAGFEWQIGKTASTIKFVKEAEQFLSLLPDDRWGYPEEAVEKLRKRVAELKCGDDSLLVWQSVEEYLELWGYTR